MSAPSPLRLVAPALASAAAPPVLAARGLARGFGRGGGRVEVVRGCDLALPAGALTLIRGPSGCGKSTLLAMLAGLTRPDAGSVRLEGVSVWDLSGRARDALRLARMGFVFQGSILLPWLCALEQVAFVLREMGLGRAEAEARARAALEAVGLGARMGARPATLSGGEQQRVAVALALAKAPRIVFADEPTSALDGETAARVAGLLRDLARREGAAVVCVTHDDRLLPFADRVLRMEAGRLLGEAGG